MPWIDINDHLSNVDFLSASGPQMLVAQSGRLRFDRALVETDSNNFGPRFGFAFRATDKTFVRGGYGVYYGNVRFQGILFFNPPFHTSVVLTTDRTTPTIQLTDGLPADAIQVDAARKVRYRAQEISPHLPYAQQWSFSVQRELSSDTLFEFGYYANTVHKEPRRTEVNAPLPGPGNINSRRPLQSIFVPGPSVDLDLGNIFLISRDANANFHSLQTRVEKRLSHGLSFLTSYIWSKTIGDGRGDAGDGGDGSLLPQNPLDLRAERSLASQHRDHRFVTSYVYELPVGRSQKYLPESHAVVQAALGGWTVAGITTLSSGRFTGMTVRGNPSNIGVNADRPNVVGDPHLSGDARTLERWFNTGAFVPNGPFTFGNAGCNLIEGPGLVNFDFAVYKNFHISEATRLQFRWEAFNPFNTPQFDVPNTQVGNRNFGQISAAGRPRNMQFGLKSSFEDCSLRGESVSVPGSEPGPTGWRT